MNVLICISLSEGFSILQAFDGNEGLRLFLEKRPDIVIADVMMPRMDGFEMVGKIRSTDRTTPVLFLTARSSIEDLVSGFELGANDYLRKPFRMQELIIRIKALLNRAITDKDIQTVFNIGNYTFDSVSQTLACETGMNELTHFENEILKRLCTNVNRVVDIQNLMLNLWHDDCSYNRTVRAVYQIQQFRIIHFLFGSVEFYNFSFVPSTRNKT